MARGTMLDDLLMLGIVAAGGYVAWKMYQGSNRQMEATTVRNAQGGTLLYDRSSAALLHVTTGELVSDRYGNIFRVLPGGQQVQDVKSGIVYAAAILQERYDTAE